jgi:uncharacterized protein YyaL (SSP411 family)
MANGTGKISTRKKTNPFLRYSTSRIFFLLVVLGALSFALSGYVSWGATVTLTNRLADSPSPYLREAANSPVHWQPWGEEAFEFAKKLDRPILLDDGAIWCHWCHVMDDKTYGNPEIAKFINEHFVPIKIDSDARPDLNERFQLIVSALVGHGGWPLTVFMTPDGHVFFGGGTFLPDDSYRRPGFKTLLPRIVEVYSKEKEKLKANAREIYQAIESNVTSSAQRGALSEDSVKRIEDHILNGMDPIHGGVKGREAKFPQASILDLAIELYAERGAHTLRNLVETTLDAMARGGIRDQLGGGFHRYSTDPLWIVPHFEQMDYVDAQLLKTYTLAYQMTGKPLYREVTRGIIKYVNETLLDLKVGGFYAHQDADMGPGDDGGYFTWTVDEIKKALPADEAEVILQHFDIGERGEMRENPDQNVLWVAKSPEEIAKETKVPQEKIKELISEGKKRLLDVRKKRKTPLVDRTKYAGRNGLMVTGYLEAYKVFGDKTLKDIALKSLDFIWRKLYVPKEGLYHTYANGEAHLPYRLEDQVFVTEALLQAFEVTGHPHYSKRAEELMRLAIQRLWDQGKGGFFDEVPKKEALSVLSLPMKSYVNSEVPGGNAAAALVLARLYDLTNKEIYREKAEATLAAFAGNAPALGMFAATYTQALFRFINHPAQVVIIGAEGNSKTKELWKTAFETFRPGKFVSVYDPQNIDLNALPPAVQAAAKIGMKDGVPKAYVCVGPTCAPPTSSPQQEAILIKTFGHIQK